MINVKVAAGGYDYRSDRSDVIIQIDTQCCGIYLGLLRISKLVGVITRRHSPYV